MLPSEYACPRCKCRACYPLHRKGLDWLLSPLGLRPARCLTCGRRFFARYAMRADGSVVLRKQPAPSLPGVDSVSLSPSHSVPESGSNVKGGTGLNRAA